VQNYQRLQAEFSYFTKIAAITKHLVGTGLKRKVLMANKI